MLVHKSFVALHREKYLVFDDVNGMMSKLLSNVKFKFGFESTALQTIAYVIFEALFINSTVSFTLINLLFTKNVSLGTTLKYIIINN